VASDNANDAAGVAGRWAGLWHLSDGSSAPSREQGIGSKWSRTFDLTDIDITSNLDAEAFFR
jgi:hypothetical protein